MIEKLIIDVIRLMRPFCQMTRESALQYIDESIRHLYVLSGKAKNRKNGDAVVLSLPEQQWVKYDTQSRIFSQLIGDLSVMRSYCVDATGETYEEYTRYEMINKQLQDLKQQCEKERDMIWYAMVRL